jgi:hypothetical protein
MVEDLRAVNRSATPWVIVGGHRPMYIDSTNYAPVQGDQTVAAELRAALEQDLIKYEVRCGPLRIRILGFTLVMHCGHAAVGDVCMCMR